MFRIEKRYKPNGRTVTSISFNCVENGCIWKEKFYQPNHIDDRFCVKCKKFHTEGETIVYDIDGKIIGEDD